MNIGFLARFSAYLSRGNFLSFRERYAEEEEEKRWIEIILLL